MAVVKNEYPVNGGNTGWTRSDVIDALENAFSGMDGGSGWHSGTAKTGVPCAVFPPGDLTPYNSSVETSAWQYATGTVFAMETARNFYFDVVDTGSSTYQWTRKWKENIYFYSESTAGYNSTVRLYGHRLSTGDAITFNVGTYTNTMPNGIVDGQTYYVIVNSSLSDPETWVQLAASPADAAAGTHIDFGPFNLNIGTDVSSFTQDYGTNPTVNVNQGDLIYFDVVSSGNPFYLQDQPGAYDVDRIVNSTNYSTATYRNFPVNQGIENGEFSWNTSAWLQGNYYYISQLDSNMGGTIVLLPSTSQNTNSTALRPYWDYTVSGSSVGAGRTDLQLRIYML